MGITDGEERYGLFERFTERARMVVTCAHEEARTFKHDYIGTEHLLLGLLREQGLAARTLNHLGVELEDVRGRVLAIVGPGAKEVTEQIPFTPRSRKVLELALREALSLGHNYVGTEHILLGLVREHEGVGERILEAIIGEDTGEKVRNEVIRALSGPASTSRPKPRTRKSPLEVALHTLGRALRDRAPVHELLDHTAVVLEEAASILREDSG